MSADTQPLTPEPLLPGSEGRTLVGRHVAGRAAVAVAIERSHYTEGGDGHQLGA